MLDLNAPILPWEGIGGINLKDHIKNFFDMVEINALPEKKSKLICNTLVRYELQDSLFLWFNLINGKLYKITALGDYKGMLLGKIHIGMQIEEAIKIEPSIKYDEFEEVYESSKGFYIEIEQENGTIQWISVYAQELTDYNFFIKGNW